LAVASSPPDALNATELGLLPVVNGDPGAWENAAAPDAPSRQHTHTTPTAHNHRPPCPPTHTRIKRAIPVPRCALDDISDCIPGFPLFSAECAITRTSEPAGQRAPAYQTTDIWTINERQSRTLTHQIPHP
jgi:hypothetical protein